MHLAMANPARYLWFSFAALVLALVPVGSGGSRQEWRLARQYAAPRPMHNASTASAAFPIQGTEPAAAVPLESLGQQPLSFIENQG